MVDTRKLAIGLTLFNGIGALAGSAYLLTGGEIPLELLDDSPFDDYTIPGIILGAVVGGSSLLAGVALIRRWRNAPDLTLLAGAILLGWIITEFIWIPEGWMPQLLYFVVGAAMSWAGWKLRIKESGRGL